jgi:hypothetical protein
VNVFCLGADQIDRLWHRFAHHIYRLERDGYLEANEIHHDLKDAQKQLWGLQDGEEIVGVAITRISLRACEVVGAAGSAPYVAMRELHRAIEEWAREIGCSRMRLQGRKGWIKLLGYTQTGIVAEKEL